MRAGGGAVEQVVEEFKAGSNHPEPQIRTTEVGATGKTCECSERSAEGIANR